MIKERPQHMPDSQQARRDCLLWRAGLSRTRALFRHPADLRPLWLRGRHRHWWGEQEPSSHPDMYSATDPHLGTPGISDLVSVSTHWLHSNCKMKIKNPLSIISRQTFRAAGNLSFYYYKCCYFIIIIINMIIWHLSFYYNPPCFGKSFHGVEFD